MLGRTHVELDRDETLHGMERARITCGRIVISSDGANRSRDDGGLTDIDDVEADDSGTKDDSLSQSPRDHKIKKKEQ
jgi:hypothetical protein